jgi:hypothetical protein
MFSNMRLAFIIASLFISSYAHANIITTINLNSEIYGAFNNTIDETTAPSTSPFFVGKASSYGITGNIVFTDTSGIIHNVLSTSNDDYYWSWTASQNSLIGTVAAASFFTKVELLNNGLLTSYLADIGAMEFFGNTDVFCCNNSGVLNIATGNSSAVAVPEPVSIALLTSGFIGFNVWRRKASLV